MKRSVYLGALATLLLFSSALSCTPTAAYTKLRWVEKRARLDNGLRLVVVPDLTTQLVQVDVRYEVGSAEDPPGKAGLAHLVEHMMFQHHPLGPDKPATFEIIPQISVLFNAYTWWDQTHYWTRTAKQDFETMLRLEAFRMSAGCEGIPPEQFDREREVVRNEIRGHFSDASGLIAPMLAKSVYGEGHAYSHDTGGDDAQLSNITFEDACDFMKKYYVPERASVIVAGNVDPDEVGKLVELNFGAIAKRTPAPRVPVEPIDFTYSRVDHELDIEKPQLYISWKLPPQSSPDWTKVNMLFLLAGRLSSQAEKWEFAEDVGASPFGGALAPTFVVGMTLRSNDDVDEALEAVWKIASTASWGLNGLDFTDLDKARSEQGFVESLEALDARTGFIADEIQFKRTDEDFDSINTWLFDELDRIKKTSADGYSSFVKSTLQKNKAKVIFFKAKSTGAKGDSRSALSYAGQKTMGEHEPLVDPAEARRPLPVPQSKSMLGSAEHYTLGNGMKVMLLPYEGLPLVTAQLVFANAGAAAEPAAKAGLADVAARYLRLPRDSNAYMLGLTYGAWTSDDNTTFLSRGMSIYTEEIIKILERTIKIGEYDQEAIERWQKDVKKQFESKIYRENLAYQVEIAAAIYGPDHPYTLKGAPTPKTIGAIGYDAAMDFKRGHYTASNATLVVAGNFDVKAAKGYISDNFGDWGSGHRDKPVPPDQRQRTGAEFIGVVQAKEAPQVSVAIAYPAPAGIDGQQAARMVMSEMLNIRMGQIRTELGSTYGTYATRQIHMGPSAYTMGGTIDTPRAGESIKAMRDKIEALRKGENFDKDFATARRTLLKKLLGESTVSAELTSRLATIGLYNLQPDYYDNLIVLIAAMSTAQVKALIADELRPELEIVVLKADRASLEKTFADAGMDSVRFVEPD